MEGLAVRQSKKPSGASVPSASRPDFCSDRPMNSLFPRDFSHLNQPAQDLRPQYEASIWNILRIVWHRRYLILAITAAVMLLAMLALALTPKKYVGEALIQLKFDRGGMGSAAGPPPVSMDGAALVEGEAEIMRSRAVARRVADRIYRSTSSTGASTASTPQDANAKRNVPVLDSELVALQRGLTVQNDGKSYLIHVIYTANDPVRAAMLANTFAEEYLQSRVEVSYGAAQMTSNWLAAQVKDAEGALQAADEKARAFRAGAGGSAGGVADAQAADQQVRDVISQISATRVLRMNLEGRLSRLRDAIANNAIPSALDVEGSSAAQRLLDAEVTARQEADRIASSVGVKHPLYLRAENNLKDVRAQLADAVRNTVGIVEANLATARASEQNLQQQLVDLKQAAAETQADAKTQAQLDADAATAHANLDRLQESYRQAVALTDLKPIAAEMVSQAEPLSFPASPKASLFLVLGGLGGLLASLAAVFLLEQRDTGFKTGSEVSNDLGIPCAGMIPILKKKADPADRRVHARAIKAVAVKAGIMRPHSGPMIVVVTSALPNEGKSDLVRQLASTLADGQRRVLIVENAQRERVTGRPGTTETLRGAERAVAVETMNRSEGRVSVTFFQRSSRDLADLFDQPEHLHRWIDENSSQFDVVILEAPAVMTDAQALIMARFAHLVLFAVQWNATPRKTAHAALSQILTSTSPEAVAVLTRVDMKRHRKLGLKDSLYFYDRYLDRQSASAV